MNKVICIKEFTQNDIKNPQYLGERPVLGETYVITDIISDLGVRHILNDSLFPMTSITELLYKESFISIEQWRDQQLNIIL